MRTLQTITAITVQKRQADRVNIFLDGKFAFGLAAEAAAGLQPGDILDEEAISSLQDEEAFQRAKSSALRLISYRPRSSAEVRRRLQRKKCDEEVADRVISHLQELQLLDDAAFVEYWLEQRETFKPRGRFALRQELREKGIERTLIEQALEGLDEEEMARRAVAKRGYRWADLPKDAYDQKMGRYLQRLGFGYQTVREAIAASWDEINQDNSPE